MAHCTIEYARSNLFNKSSLHIYYSPNIVLRYERRDIYSILPPLWSADSSRGNRYIKNKAGRVRCEPGVRRKAGCQC